MKSNSSLQLRTGAGLLGFVGFVYLFGCTPGKVTNTGDGTPQTRTVASIALASSAGATIPARGTVQLNATAYDASQNPITDQAFSFASSDTTTVIVSASGVVSSVGAVGNVMLTASAGGVKSNPVSIAVVTDPPSTVIKAVSDPSVVIAGNTFGDSVCVRVVDAGKNPVQGAAVAFAVTKGAGKIGPAIVVTDQQGRAAAQFTTDSVQGVNAATASVSSLAPVTFSITTSFGYATLALTLASAVGIVDQYPDTDSRAPPNSWWVGLKCNPPSLVITAGDSITNVSVVGWPWTTGVSAAWVQQFLQTPMISAATLGAAASLKPNESLPLWSGAQLFYYSAPFPAGTRWPWTALFRVTYTVTSTGKVQQTDLQWQCT